VFAPNSSARRRVVPTAAPTAGPAEPAAEVGRKTGSGGEPRSKVETARTYRVPWAELLRKVFALDVLACPECSGRMQLIAFIASEAVARRILDHLGLDATGPPLARAQAPDDLLDPAPGHDVVDPVYTD
jgi:hypothetical protein